MTGRELLLRALKCKHTHRPAWVPFVGSHGARLIGVAAEAYHHDPKHIVAGLREADRLYKPDGLPIVFDLQVEAEVLGCELRWADHDPPAVVSHPLSGGGVLDDLPAFSADAGRLPVIAQALRDFRAEVGDRLALYGLICGPFTLALHLMGNDIFLKMFEDVAGVERVLDFCTEVACKAADVYLDNGADVVAVVDPMTSQISPAHFAQFVGKRVDRVFDHIHGRGGLASLFVCGDATRNLEQMCNCTCDNVSVDENISLEYLRELGEKTGRSIGGNLKLTSVLLMGQPDDARRDAIRCIDACGDYDGFVLAPGCDLPFDVPTSNMVAVAEMIHDEYAREVARERLSTATADTFDDVEIPDYASAAQVIIDVITLDSGTCAPCQYMVAAAEEAASRFEGRAVVREHKIRSRDGLGFMVRLGVEHVPTICINGDVEFSSIIPDSETLAKAIARAEGGQGV